MNKLFNIRFLLTSGRLLLFLALAASLAITLTPTQTSFGAAAVSLIDIHGPTGSVNFGSSVTALSNGNIVIIDPLFSPPGKAEVGAVYLYDARGSLISALTGSTPGDRIGLGGVTALTNGNFVVKSPFWDNGAAIDAGAATWGSGMTGITGTVTVTNSLVGNATNNMVGMSAKALSNGNYVVSSPQWDNSTFGNVGAATWGDGTTGTTGTVTTSNSLVGSASDDLVGLNAVALTNGNYVVGSPLWDNGTIADAGAATWGNGTTGSTGVVTTTNSLVGSTATDVVGFFVIPLVNGNYVVRSPFWDNGAVVDAGAATWENGTAGISGVVTTTNSLVGSTATDMVGISVTPLVNGNYVVCSPNWTNGSAGMAGAATWGNGMTGITGAITTTNSLVGSASGDKVGETGVIALTNGNYVVNSQSWDNGALVDAGAATWGNGTAGTTGVVTTTNSLVGSTATDMVGLNGAALTNGHYVVGSQFWDNGTIADAGAATWGNGTTGSTGVVTTTNSLVGSAVNDRVGYAISALVNGNYVVGSPLWDNGAVVDAGAATWENGIAGISGVVTTTNSLVGSTATDQVGIITIPVVNGNYLVCSLFWDNGAVVNAGAATWGNGTIGITGPVTTANSLVGSQTGDLVCLMSLALPNGDYAVFSPFWDNGALGDAGAVSWGFALTGLSGTIDAQNSVLGAAPTGGLSMIPIYDAAARVIVVGRRLENIVTIFTPYQDQFMPSIYR